MKKWKTENLEFSEISEIFFKFLILRYGRNLKLGLKKLEKIFPRFQSFPRFPSLRPGCLESLSCKYLQNFIAKKCNFWVNSVQQCTTSTIQHAIEDEICVKSIISSYIQGLSMIQEAMQI